MLERDCHAFDSFVMAIQLLCQMQAILSHIVKSHDWIIGAGNKEFQWLQDVDASQIWLDCKVSSVFAELFLFWQFSVVVWTFFRFFTVLIFSVLFSCDKSFINLVRRVLQFAFLFFFEGLFVFFVHDRQDLFEVEFIQVTVHASCNESRGDWIFVVSDHVKDWVGENEPSDEFVFSRVIKVKELVIGGDAIDFGLFTGLDWDDTIDDDTTESNIFHWFVGFLFEKNDIFLVVFKEADRLSVSERKYFFSRKIELIKMFVWLKVTLFGLVVRLLAVN